MAAKKKKKTKAQRSKELSKIKKLLKKEEFRTQAVELLVSLDDDELWSGVRALVQVEVDDKGYAQLNPTSMFVLAHLPEHIAGVAEAKALVERIDQKADVEFHVAAVSQLRELRIRGWRPGPWKPLTELPALKHLKTLDLSNMVLGDAEPLGQLGITKLTLRNCTMSALPKLDQLEELMLERQGAFEGNGLPKLRLLRAIASTHVNWDVVADSTKLEQIAVTQKSGLTNFDALANKPLLRDISFDTCNKLESIEGLRDATKLRTLRFRDARGLHDVGPLANASELQRLELLNCGVVDLSPLRGLQELEVLNLTGCDKAVGVDALQELPKLRVIALGRTNFTPKDVHPSVLDWATWADSPDIRALFAARPR